ncbi:DNA topoisomerase 6 subunit A-like [Silene latifolia]|uniref:DNA topoisomerase 6 subunit A-like n=1 Tax=Silene latifolia TaxID=37657 RepID=UPI003D7708F5
MILTDLESDRDIISKLENDPYDIPYDIALTPPSDRDPDELAFTSTRNCNFVEVTRAKPSQVQEKIETLISDAAESINTGKGFSFSVPSRAPSSHLFHPTRKCLILKNNPSSRRFKSVSTVLKATITARILALLHQVARKGIHVTKRDLYYNDVPLFQDQTQSDAVLDDVACMVGFTRSSLGVMASTKGAVIGRLVFTEKGHKIDCAKMGLSGKVIPANIDGVEIITQETDALFVLIVEKDDVFLRLVEDEFYNRFPCIIIKGKGQHDVATRLFLSKIQRKLGLRVLALVDGDPYGLKILSVYGCGSKNMLYDSYSLITQDIKWLGIRPSDLEKYAIPEQCRLPMTEQDIKVGNDLLKEDFVKNNPGWVKELKRMVQTKKKAEIQALSSFGFQYLTGYYLPHKLQKLDWV